MGEVTLLMRWFIEYMFYNNCYAALLMTPVGVIPNTINEYIQ